MRNNEKQHTQANNAHSHRLSQQHSLYLLFCEQLLALRLGSCSSRFSLSLDSGLFLLLLLLMSLLLLLLVVVGVMHKHRVHTHVIRSHFNQPIILQTDRRG